MEGVLYVREDCEDERDCVALLLRDVLEELLPDVLPITRPVDVLGRL